MTQIFMQKMLPINKKTYISWYTKLYRIVIHNNRLFLHLKAFMQNIMFTFNDTTVRFMIDYMYTARRLEIMKRAV